VGRFNDFSETVKRRGEMRGIRGKVKRIFSGEVI
jgi:hypothetical protein